MNDLLRTARALAEGAGEGLVRAFNTGVAISHKGAVDIVTSADQESEAFIKAGIRAAYPDHAILAEESGSSAGTGAYRWVIDPLDGTVNYAHNLPHWCVLIGVQERRPSGDFETVVGVTWDPLHKELFVASRGGGASLNGQPLRVSKQARLIDSIGATGFGYDRLFNPLDNHAEFCRLNLITQGVRRFGSAGLDLAYVACGRLDFFWEYRLNPWDLTPGVLLVREAGGQVSDLYPSARLQEGNLLASNGVLHGATLAALASTAAVPVNSRDGLRAHLPAALTDGHGLPGG